MRARLRRGLLGLSLVLVFAAVAVAAQESLLDEIVQRGELRVGMTGDYKPFTYRDGDDWSGIDVDLARSLAKTLGVKVVIVPTTWKAITDDLMEGKYDIAMGGVSVKMDRQRRGLFSIPYFVTGKTPITRAENVDRFQTLEQIDRPEVTVIVNPGGTNERFARAHLKKAKIIVYDDNVTIFDKIVDGTADLMMTDGVETLLQQKLRPELKAVHPYEPFDRFEKAYLMPRDIIWKEYVDQWLHTAELTGELQAVCDRWLK